MLTTGCVLTLLVQKEKAEYTQLYTPQLRPFDRSVLQMGKHGKKPKNQKQNKMKQEKKGKKEKKKKIKKFPYIYLTTLDKSVVYIMFE